MNNMYDNEKNTSFDLKKAQGVMLEILEAIDRVCQKHNIAYWLEGGTLLGAVRHRGFIPWDDDCDIGMLSSDYRKFAKIAQQELGDKFFFQNKETDKNYPKRIVKVRKNGTKLVEWGENREEAFHQGIFVDIFVWEYYYGWEININKMFRTIQYYRNLRRKYPPHSIRRVWYSAITVIPHAIQSTLLYIYIGMRHFYRENAELPYLNSAPKFDNEGFFLREEFFPLKRTIPFEGKYFLVPNNPDVYLKTLYGNYMELPPDNQRIGHAKIIEF